MKEMVPASFLSRAEAAGPTAKPSLANAMSLNLMTAMVASLWSAREDSGYASFWVERLKDSVAYVELPLE